MACFRILVYLSLLIELVGCISRFDGNKNKGRNQATLKYGAQESYIVENGMLGLPPGAKVAVCKESGFPEAPQLVYSAILQWQKIIARPFPVVLFDNCEDYNPSDYHGVHTLIGECSGSMYAHHSAMVSTEDSHLKKFKIPISENILHEEIVFCENHKPQARTALHEVGHGFGLCDQYDNTVLGNLFGSFHPNCRNHIRSRLPGFKTIMGTLTFTDSLHRDDILGVRLLSCSASVSEANLLWAKQNMEEIRLWKRDRDFRSEIERLQKIGGEFLPECL